MKSLTDNYQREIGSQKELLATAQNAANEATDNASIVSATKDVLQIKKKIADIELKYATDKANAELDNAKEIYRLECAKLDLLNNAATAAANESYKFMPKKYRRVLNESNIHQAKIYMNNLVVNDESHIIKDMRDFKRVFCESELVYGKDKNGYYVLCIDQEDFNKLYNTLQNEGYGRDEIFANVMPQILDRSSMISGDFNKNI